MALLKVKRAVRGLGRLVGLNGTAASLGDGVKDAPFYDAIYAGTEEYQRAYPQSLYYFLWAVIVDRVRRAQIRRVLEIGCGSGQLAAFLLDQGVEKYTGLDFSPIAIEMARRAAPRGRFLVGDARDAAIHARVEHDLVVCTEVLEHVEEDLQVVAHFRPGKRCICSVPNFPYDSHVRHFRNGDEVRARYGAFFDDLDVATFKSPCAPEDAFFLFDGVRSDGLAEPDA